MRPKELNNHFIEIEGEQPESVLEPCDQIHGFTIDYGKFILKPKPNRNAKKMFSIFVRKHCNLAKSLVYFDDQNLNSLCDVPS